jgi:transcription elongation factor Elf1
MYEVVKKLGPESSCTCPHCGNITLFNTFDYEENMQEVGKYVVDCKTCDRLFTIRDDGDCEFVSHTKSN